MSKISSFAEQISALEKNLAGVQRKQGNLRSLELQLELKLASLRAQKKLLEEVEDSETIGQ